MEFTNPFETSFREKFVVIDPPDASPAVVKRSDVRAATLPHLPLLHLSSHQNAYPRPYAAVGRPGNVVAGTSATIVTAANFSYPRPEGPRLSRHESSDSWSSIASSASSSSATSVPGMVADSSGSEVSLDDDYCQYNASASELWDSFFFGKAETGGQQQQQQSSTVKQSSPSSSLRPAQDYFSCDLIQDYVEADAEDDAEDDNDTITLSPFGGKPDAVTNTPVATTTSSKEVTQRQCHGEPQTQPEPQPELQSEPSPRSSPRRRPTTSSRRAPATYSVYPKLHPPPPPPPLTRLPLPPRTSSLGPAQLPTPSTSTSISTSSSFSSLASFPAPPSLKSQPSSSFVLPRQRRLRGSKSTHNLLLHLTPSSSSSTPPSPPRPSTAGKSSTTARSVPVSPAYPPPPPPRALRASVSAANLRETLGSGSGYNATAPLPPLVPCDPLPSLPPMPTVPPLPPALSTGSRGQNQHQQGEQQRFVSVFELDDSDAESIAENAGSGSGSGSGSGGFAKRLMSRSGLHKKSSGGFGGFGSAQGAAGEKRRGSAPSASAAAPEPGSGTTTPVPVVGETSPRRNRGGSLGRILGLKGR